MIFSFETSITASAMLYGEGLIHATSAVHHGIKKEQYKYSKYPQTEI